MTESNCGSPGSGPGVEGLSIVREPEASSFWCILGVNSERYGPAVSCLTSILRGVFWEVFCGGNFDLTLLWRFLLGGSL